jgi:hypothetical protein
VWKSGGEVKRISSTKTYYLRLTGPPVAARTSILTTLLLDGVTRHGSVGEKKKSMLTPQNEKKCQVGTNAWPIAP